MTSELLQRARVMDAVQQITELEQETFGDSCLVINLQPILHDLISDEARIVRESQTALRDVVAILDAITGGTDRDVVFFEIGRATMTAKRAVRA